MIQDKRKNKIANRVFKKYITLDSEGYIDFKGTIKHEINKKNITKQDALFIILELLYDIVNSRLTDFNDISAFRFNKIKKIKNFNEESNVNDLKLLFNHDYKFEKEILKENVHKLESIKKINKPEVTAFNNDFIDNLGVIKQNNAVKSHKKTKSVKSTTRFPKNIKIKLDFDYLNRNELCYIFDLNPELTFEKTKVLRNRLFNQISELSIDVNLLINASPNELKNFLKPLRDKEKENEKVHKHYTNLISKVKKFNSYSISEILSSKEDYLKIYEDINDNFPNFNDKDFKYFQSYHDYVNNIEELNSIKKELDLQTSAFEELNNYISNCYLNHDKRIKLKGLLNEFQDLLLNINKFPKVLETKLLQEDENLKNIIAIYEGLDSYISLSETDKNNFIRIHNEKFLDDIVNENEEFFKDITDIPKKRAIVLDEDNIRVVAGAGTGKTFTIQKKVKYLVEKQNISPEKILCLCYTNKGANELDKKVNADLKNTKVEVCTFHEFCRRIDKYCKGEKTTNRYLLNQVVRNYFKDIIHDDKKMRQLTEFFSYYNTPPTINIDEFEGYDDLIELESDDKLLTLKEKYYLAKLLRFSLKGEYAENFSELIIANYLFMHNIDYEFKKVYNHSFINVLKRFLYSGKFLSMKNIGEDSNEIIVKKFINVELELKQYCPDFYLTDYDIYIEHFGKNSNNNVWLHNGYEKQMEDIISCHEIHGTKLIKTFYHYFEKGVLVEELDNLLKENNVKIGQRESNEILEVLMTTNKVDDFKKFNKLIKNFINIFEAHNLSIEKFTEFKNQTKFVKNGYIRKRQELFLDIICDIYNSYCEYNQTDIIDHNGEISNALKLIKSKKYDKLYEYVLIDEYQDINLIRCNLLQELQKNTKCKIFVVGDDWQSIYKFNGSDVGLFINFEKYFPNAETIKLEENRRNTQKIIDISSEFILRNKNQEDKSLISVKQEYYPNLKPIKIVSFDWYSYKGKDRILKLDAILEHIYKNNSKKDLKILILGRINKDLNKFTNNALFKEQKKGKYRKVLYSKKRNADITFMTIHQSKGLEYDEVIMVNFESHITGFPNRIEDDPLLYLVKDHEECPFAEERRLFYVALTRTLNNVYLLAPDENESIFIKELRNKFNIENLYLSIDKNMDNHLYDDSFFFSQMEYHRTNIPCPNCDDGKITLVVNNSKGTSYFRCSNFAIPNPSHFDGGPYFGEINDLKYVEKCPSCRGMLIRQGDVLKCCLNSHSGCLETKELKLDKKDMEYDE